MEQNLRVGLPAVGSYLIKSEHAAKHVGSVEVEALSTPAMMAFIEKTARQAVESKLPEGEIIVSARKPKPCLFTEQKEGTQYFF